MRNLVIDFTKAEREELISNCAFTYSERALFDLRANELSLENCAELMFVSVKTVGRINKRMNSKILKVTGTSK